MRRQTNTQPGLAARWPVRPMDVDPFQLPARFSLPVKSVAGKLMGARDRIRIEGGRIAVEREVLGRRAIVREYRAQDFSGVAIRAALVGENGDTFAVSVNLHHADPELCIPLHMSFDMNDVNARWQSWGRALGLPLLAPSPDGTWREPVARLGRLAVGPAFGRQARKALAGRRSWMSALRETGRRGDMPMLGGTEIIARG